MDEILIEAEILLSNLRPGEDDKINRIMEIFHVASQNNIDLTGQFIFTSIVYYPESLIKLLNLCKIMKLDYSSMISRCLEYKDSESHQLSLDILLKNIRNHSRGWDSPITTLFLFNGRRIINKQLYEQVKSEGIRDIYYELSSEGKPINSYDVEINSNNDYIGFRRVYHLLYYGGSRRKELLNLWEENGYDCTFTAACEFFNVDIDDPSCIKTVTYLLS